MISSNEYVTILFGEEGGGLDADGIAFWYLHYGEMVFIFSWISTMVKWCLSPHYDEMVFVSSLWRNGVCLLVDLSILGDRLVDQTGD